MLVIPWWHLYPWWPFVAFSSLLWPVGVFAWWFVVQSATSMDTAVFCGICDNYGIYGGTVGLQCISNLFLVIFTPRRGFSAKFRCFGWKVIFSNIAISISAAILILHCGPQWFSHGALALCTLTRRWGSNFWALELQFCHPQIQGPPQYYYQRGNGCKWISLYPWCSVWDFFIGELPTIFLLKGRNSRSFRTKPQVPPLGSWGKGNIACCCCCCCCCCGGGGGGGGGGGLGKKTIWRHQHSKVYPDSPTKSVATIGSTQNLCLIWDLWRMAVETLAAFNCHPFLFVRRPCPWINFRAVEIFRWRG